MSTTAPETNKLDARPIKKRTGREPLSSGIRPSLHVDALPSGWRVSVLPMPREKTAGGLFIPETAQNMNYGQILFAGLPALDVMASNAHRIGDIVGYGKYAGTWDEYVDDGGKTHNILVMSVNDILVNRSSAARMWDNKLSYIAVAKDNGAVYHVIEEK